MRPVTINIYFLRALLVLLLMTASLLLVPLAPADAKTIEGASCVPGSANAIRLLGYQKYAESFTPSHSGKLTRGFIETYNLLDKPATYTVEIWNADAQGLPAGPGPLASTTVNNPGQGYAFEYPVFSSPAKVVASYNYAIVVTVLEKDVNGVVIASGNPCADTFFLYNSGTGAFEVDASERDMEYSISVTFRRHHHHR